MTNDTATPIRVVPDPAATLARLIHSTDQRLRLAVVGSSMHGTDDMAAQVLRAFLEITPPGAFPAPDTEPRLRSDLLKLTFPNGSKVCMYDGRQPSRLRGPLFHGAWLDAKIHPTHQSVDLLIMATRLRITDFPRREPVVLMAGPPFTNEEQ